MHDGAPAARARGGDDAAAIARDADTDIFRDRLVEAGGVRWSVRTAGAGPTMLLLHGTGASADSYDALVPLLASRFSLVLPDLPGHARSAGAPRAAMSLDGMARAVGALVDALGVRPAVAVGHSAGAAVLVRMALDGRIAPSALVGLNAALVPLDGVLRAMSPIAKLLALTPGVPTIVSHLARDDRAVRRLVDSTGSMVDDDGAARYAALIRDPRHVAGAIAMMASWDLDPTWAELPKLVPAPLLIVGDRDRTVPSSQARRVAARVPGAAVVALPGLGHLAHEEAPGRVADEIVAHAAARGVLEPGQASNNA